MSSIEDAMLPTGQDVMLSDQPSFSTRSLASNDSISADTMWRNGISPATTPGLSPSRELMDASHDGTVQGQSTLNSRYVIARTALFCNL